MQFAQLNGITLHYQIIGGPSEKPAIVFVNSLGTDFRIWRDVIVRLVGNYPVVAYDKRGHGLSGIGSPPYAMADHVADLEALLDHLEISQAVICGVSVGGMIAQGLAAKAPERIRGLVLCDTGHKIGTDELWNERIAAVEKDGIKAISDNILDRWFSKGFRAEKPAEYQGYANMLTRQPVCGYVGTSVALRDTDYTESTSKLVMPTLCVVGEEDGSTPPALVEELAGLIPGAEYQVIQNAGHLPSIEQPDRLANLIKSFLTRLLASDKQNLET
jgi:3-oxoadipate enol-lactonase